MIRCQCGKVVFDGLVLKIRVGQFSKGFMNLKCPQCRMYLNGLPIGILTGDIKQDVDFSKNHKEVEYDGKGAHSECAKGCS